MMDLIGALSSTVFTGPVIAVGATIFVGTLLVSIVLVVLVLISLPPKYFHRSNERHFMAGHHLAVRSVGIIAKNLVGAILVILGLVMSLPGFPGQGILTLLIAIMLLDFPGKRALEHKIVSRPSLLRVINRLRQKFSRPPLVLD
jgi:hypothetical protein